MTSVTPLAADTSTVRTVEQVLAHAHLRLGSLALARTELETMAGLGTLDPAGLVDLAEVRWRTGDLAEAGEAAGEALRGQEEFPIALLIAAEAAAALGRPSEARRLASRAMAAATGSIDVIFAGMHRSPAWPTDADEPPPTAPTLFDRAPESAGRAEESGSGTEEPEPATGTAAAGPITLGFWDESAAEDPGSRKMPDPALELEAGRAALVAGIFDQAALRFAIALRLAPALAAAVLQATAGARVPSLIIVRGDAYRLTGHEMEAREAYLVAAHGGLPERRRRPRVKASKTVATITDAAPDPKPLKTSQVDAQATDAIDAPTTDASGVTEGEGADAPEPPPEPASQAEPASQGEAADATDPPGGTVDEPPA